MLCAPIVTVIVIRTAHQPLRYLSTPLLMSYEKAGGNSKSELGMLSIQSRPFAKENYVLQADLFSFHRLIPSTA
jgi:hypothetical protein